MQAHVHPTDFTPTLMMLQGKRTILVSRKPAELLLNAG